MYPQSFTWLVIEDVVKQKDIILHRINAEIPGGQFDDPQIYNDPNLVYISGEIIFGSLHCEDLHLNETSVCKQIYKGGVLGRGGQGRPRITYVDQIADVPTKGRPS